MKKKTLIVLVLLVLLLTAVAVAGIAGLHYWETHLFIDHAAYPLDAERLDLRGQDISFQHYDTLHWQLPNCEILWDVPFQNGKVASNASSIQVTSLTQEDLDLLYRYFPNLNVLDATGCEEYALLEQFQTKKPECTVTYQVALGGACVDPGTAELLLGPEDFDLATLKENLIHLPLVTDITFQSSELTPEEYTAICQEFANITFHATVSVLGTECDSETASLNLAGMTSEEVAQVKEKLPLLTGLKEVELVGSDGSCSLSMADVKELKEAAPNVLFHYVFDFYGKTISTTDKEVMLKNVKIGDEGADDVRAALDLMNGCQRFVLDSCGLSNEVLAQIRDEYRGQTKLVWRTTFAKGSALTDVEALYVPWHLNDSNCKNLIYFEDVRYLDAGHNEKGDWTDVSFVAGMPNLEVIIISGSSVKDLSAFENCKKLRVLEAGYCGYISDISPLSGCESLEMLNISFTSVKDLSPLDELEHISLVCALNGSSKRVSANEQQRFHALKPDCETHYIGSQPYGSCWRYQLDNELAYRDWYKEVRIALDYDNYEKNFDTGWYLDVNGNRTQSWED